MEVPTALNYLAEGTGARMRQFYFSRSIPKAFKVPEIMEVTLPVQLNCTTGLKAAVKISLLSY